MFGARRGVEIAADSLNLLGYVARRAPPRALERHMFEKVRQAVLVGSFVARSGPDKDAERGGLKMRHAIGGDPEPRRQSGDLDAHDAARFDARAARARIKRSISCWSLGKIANFSCRSKRPARWPGKSGRIACRAFDRGGKFGGMGGAQDNQRALRSVRAFALRAALMPTAVCGSARKPASRQLRAISRVVSASVTLNASNSARISCSGPGVDRKLLGLPQPRH